MIIEPAFGTKAAPHAGQDCSPEGMGAPQVGQFIVVISPLGSGFAQLTQQGMSDAGLYGVLQ